MELIKRNFWLFLMCWLPYQGYSQTMYIGSDEDFVKKVKENLNYNDFVLTGTHYYTTTNQIIERGNVTVRKSPSVPETIIHFALQLKGNNITVDGLTWLGESNTLKTDPGTLAIAGNGCTIRNCQFRNFSSAQADIIKVGRYQDQDGSFGYSPANNTIIESCKFDNWGYNCSNKTACGGGSSSCISIGAPPPLQGPSPVPFFQNIKILNNEFVNGPYKKYGNNAPIKAFEPVTNILIDGNLLRSVNDAFEIKTNNVTVRRNTIDIASGYEVLSHRSGFNNLYEFNLVSNVTLKDPVNDPQSASFGFYIRSGANVVFRNNIFNNCIALGRIDEKEISATSPLNKVLIYNNTFVDIMDGIVYDHPNNPPIPQNINIYNNIFYGYGNPVVSVRDFDPQSLNLISNNLFYNNVSSVGSSPIVANPIFVGKAAGNYRLQPNSPAIDNGHESLAFILSQEQRAFLLDYDLVIRPVDGNGDNSKKMDIGAFEYFPATLPKIVCPAELTSTLSQNLNGDYLNYLSLNLVNATIAPNQSSTLKAHYEVAIPKGSTFEATYGSNLVVSTSGCTHLSSYNSQQNGSNSLRLESSQEASDLALSNKPQDDSSLESNFVLYPNPSSGAFSIGLVGADVELMNLEVYSSKGEVIYFSTFEKGKMIKTFDDIKIDNAGIYFVKIMTSKGQYISKLVVNK